MCRCYVRNVWLKLKSAECANLMASYHWPWHLIALGFEEACGDDDLLTDPTVPKVTSTLRSAAWNLCHRYVFCLRHFRCGMNSVYNDNRMIGSYSWHIQSRPVWMIRSCKAISWKECRHAVVDYQAQIIAAMIDRPTGKCIIWAIGGLVAQIRLSNCASRIL